MWLGIEKLAVRISYSDVEPYKTWIFNNITMTFSQMINQRIFLRNYRDKLSLTEASLNIFGSNFGVENGISFWGRGFYKWNLYKIFRGDSGIITVWRNHLAWGRESPLLCFNRFVECSSLSYWGWGWVNALYIRETFHLCFKEGPSAVLTTRSQGPQ